MRKAFTRSTAVNADLSRSDTSAHDISVAPTCRSDFSGRQIDDCDCGLTDRRKSSRVAVSEEQSRFMLANIERIKVALSAKDKLVTSFSVAGNCTRCIYHRLQHLKTTNIQQSFRGT